MNYCIKLTDQGCCTHQTTQWHLGEWNPDGVRDGVGDLCSGSFYHGYDTNVPELALFLNPIHGSYAAPRVFVAEWRGERRNDGAMKFGATEMRLVQELSGVNVTTEQRVAFAILVVVFSGAYASPAWHEWAERWLSGDDRSRSTAYVAANAAAYAANAAYAAKDAANAAAYAANVAAYAANAAKDAYDAAYDAANAAYAANTTMRNVLANAAAWALTLA